MASVDITITYEKPDGSKVSHTVKTASDGTFSDRIDADIVGEWKAYASWPGNEYYESAMSETMTVTVKPTFLEQNLLIIIAIAAIIVIIAIALILLLRRRKPPLPPPPP